MPNMVADVCRNTLLQKKYCNICCENRGLYLLFATNHLFHKNVVFVHRCSLLRNIVYIYPNSVFQTVAKSVL